MDEFNNNENLESENKKEEASYNAFDETFEEKEKQTASEPPRNPEPDKGWNSSMYYGYNEPKKPKKNPGTIIAVVSCFIIFAMLVTVGYGLFKDSGNIIGSDKANNTSSPSNGVNFTQYEKPAGAENVEENADGSYSPEDLYTLSSENVVGVLKYASGYISATGQGSGVIISADGYIVTNAHVISDADAVSIVLAGEDEEIEAEVIGSDDRSDIAILKINRTDLPYVKFGNSDDVNVGEMVAAIGNPGGLYLKNSLTVGYISGIDRQITVDNYTMNYLQTDAAINPGNSGGALFNMYGQLIGINSAKISDEQYEGIGFAIPINNAVPIIESIIENGYVKGRVRLGLTLQEINEMASRFNGIPQGLYVYSIDTTCDVYGKLQRGDIITEFNGKAISTISELYAKLDDYAPGDSVTLKVYRTNRNQGYYTDISVVLSEDTGKTYFAE
ncbi:MAG: trypsin-like peptidase domain-containing protein [Oscillospiraceae bacterium]|nr:trypsin-like peptidase domain-containing protein [Oscillospiraceae bacterium]